MKRAKVLLWRSITIIDSCSNDAAWEELQRLCEKNLPSTTLKPFLKYYRQNRKYWSLKDSPRRVFLGRSFANSITESANFKVKHNGVCSAKSTLRVIYIACATFDDTIINPDVMQVPPVVTPKTGQCLENRRQLLRSLSDVSTPIMWKDIPDQLTHLCLKTLIQSFQSASRYTSKESGGLFHVQRQGSKDNVASIVKEIPSGKLVCMSCHYINLFASPCPHVLSAAKVFRAKESVLPFLERSFRTVSGPFCTLDELFPPETDTSEYDVVALDDELLGLKEILDEDKRLPEPEDDDDEENVDAEAPDCDSDSDADTLETTSREATIAIKEREALQHGKTAQKARKWLLENVLLPRQRDIVYSKEKFQHVYHNALHLLDQYESTAHKMFPEKKKNKNSAIRRIGYYENSKPHVPTSAKPSRDGPVEKSETNSNNRKSATANNVSKKKRSRSQSKDIDSKWDMDRFVDFDRKTLRVRVKWEGHSDSTWEPAKNLIEDLGSAFEEFWDSYTDGLSLKEYLKAEQALTTLRAEAEKKKSFKRKCE
eukprot:gb/GECG01016397.1/.p1 GENE.gb/GECG01016397.1/~~gb/GECG01016397.1/.p1  ORF type:complete len:540 (+),score=73.80 gb/GECG01016397.1/:1-1620(+)